MQRLLSFRTLTQSNFKLLTCNKTCFQENRCYFAIGPHRGGVVSKKIVAGYEAFNYQPVRQQMTTARAGVSRLSKRKRKRTKNRKWTELLQVTDVSMKETRAKVEKLKAKNLNEFICPGAKTDNKTVAVNSLADFSSLEYRKINLEMFEDHDFVSSHEPAEAPVLFLKHLNENIKSAKDLREILASYEQFKAVSSEIIETDNEHFDLSCEPQVAPILEEDIEYGINETADRVEEVVEPATEPPVPAKAKSKPKEYRFRSKLHKSPEHELKAKQKTLLNNLNSYLEVCVETGMLNRGLGTVLYYRQKGKKFQYTPKVNSIEPFNTLLHGFAAEGNHTKVKEIIEILKEDGISLNAQSFAAIFECLGREESNDQIIDLLKQYRVEAENMGISLNDIMEKSKFLYDQREIVLDAIRKLEPNFAPKYTPPEVNYRNELLNELNKPPKVKKTNRNKHLRNTRHGFTPEKLEKLSLQQVELELKGSVTVKSIESTKDKEITDKYRTKLGHLQSAWKSEILAAINRDMNILRVHVNNKSRASMSYFIYLKSLDTGQFVDILLKEVRMLAEGSETYSPTVGQLYRELGQKVYMRYQIERRTRNGILDKTGEVYKQFCDQWLQSETANSRKLWQTIVHENRVRGASLDYHERMWPLNVMIGIGRFLYNILMRDIKFDANIMRNAKVQNVLPAFYTVFRNEGKYVKEEVKPHPVLSRLYRASQQRTLTFDTNLVPMLCPPQPWSTKVNGGYLLSKCELIRLPHQAIQQWSRINDADPRDLYPCLDSLNQLATIPWKVNTNVLDVVIKVFNDGGDPNLDVPQPPTALAPLVVESKDQNLTNKEKYDIFRQKLARRRKQAEMYSLWCDTLYRLSLANHYRDKVFWLPHNMDFRGRVYPIPPHLNHLGSDLARSLLVFYETKPLGSDGLSWLKLHCINLTGKKKRDSIRDRLLYAEDVLNDIVDSGENPLTGRMWWVDSDEPWQTLATCIEIANVLKSPNPEAYMCRFPIHQDGSCNGLQHYAALGRDRIGATSVNLVPCDVPQDVYSSVAALVENSRANDESNGMQIAKILNGFVRRKVIKQTVMTTVYGVTRYGARLQIARQLKDIPEFPKEWVWPASTYLTTKTFESLREMFTSTKEIQDWLTDCARLISAVSGQNVEWITPLGLPVVQPYSRTDQKRAVQNASKVQTTPMDMHEKPNVVKQKNAFPPNFIHSLDSSHMMLTSLHCERKGVTFVSVHDCFWTHACTVPDMNHICREQFVALHSQPILEDLSKYLVQRFSYSDKDIKNDGSVLDLARHKLNKTLVQVPEKGDFDLKNVLNSIYFFS